MAHDTQKLALQSSRIGMVINVMLPAGVALLAFAVQASGIAPSWELATSSPPTLFLIFGALALGELVAGYIMKKQLFSAQRVEPIRHNPAAVNHWLMRSSVIIYTLGASPILYGSILYVFSGDLRQLAFFGIVTLLAYRLFHPTADQLEEIFRGPEVTA